MPIQQKTVPECACGLPLIFPSAMIPHTIAQSGSGTEKNQQQHIGIERAPVTAETMASG
jgi:hypothetical protein